jgi:tripeptide aminopeptidase
MDSIKIEKLKAILEVPSKTGQEQRLVAFLEDYLSKEGYDYFSDKKGNIYVTKGKADSYPLVLAHTDTVHQINDIVAKEEMKPNTKGEIKLALKGYDKKGKPSGIGGDDKAGVFICLELLEKFDTIKVFLPVSEETGCHGSEYAMKNHKDFFKDVGYAIMFDSPENNSLSYSLMGNKLNNDDGEFRQLTEESIRSHGIDKWQHHPYTDAMVIREQFDIACLNLAAGYYQYHTANEYVIIEDVENAINLGTEIITKCGNTRYEESVDMYGDINLAFGKGTSDTGTDFLNLGEEDDYYITNENQIDLDIDDKWSYLCDRIAMLEDDIDNLIDSGATKKEVDYLIYEKSILEKELDNLDNIDYIDNGFDDLDDIEYFQV